jgi:hypothetical protein
VIEVLDARDRMIERLRDLTPDLVIIRLLEAETDTVALPLPPATAYSFSPATANMLGFMICGANARETCPRTI